MGVGFMIVPRPSAVGFVCRRAKHVCQSFQLPSSHSLCLFPSSGAGLVDSRSDDLRSMLKWIAFVLEPALCTLVVSVALIHSGELDELDV